MDNPRPPASARGRALWQALLEAPGPLLADGAMGTMLFQAGLEFGDPPEAWNVLHPDRVRLIHRGYLEAGARLILSNTFGGNRFRLAMHGLQGRVAEFNRMGAEIARAEVEAAGDHAVVAGDIGPSGAILAPLGELEYEAALEGFAEQAGALAAGGVDVIWIETMSALEEIHAAIEGVRRVAPELPLIATMTFDTRGRTMMGVTPEQAAQALEGWGADAIGGNCGNGPGEIEGVIEKMHAAVPAAVLVAKSNAGIPRLVQGRAVYQAGPTEMADHAAHVRSLGARVIGACCGSTPAHLRAMAEALRE
ncbi:MAG TPA: homocysteine S-methyltransferase family protein [Anaerolineales bacterium]